MTALMRFKRMRTNRITHSPVNMVRIQSDIRQTMTKCFVDCLFEMKADGRVGEAPSMRAR